MPRLITEWSTDDPQLARVLSTVQAMLEASIERMAAEAALHSWQAMDLHQRIGVAQGHAAEARAWRGRRRTEETTRAASAAPDTQETSS